MSNNGFEVTHVERSKESARAAYDRLSKWYDLLAGSSEKKFADIGLQKLNAKAGEKILEIGYGTGNSLVSLVQLTGKATGWTCQLACFELRRTS